MKFKRTPTEKALKLRHDLHQRNIRYRPGADMSQIAADKLHKKLKPKKARTKFNVTGGLAANTGKTAGAAKSTLSRSTTVKAHMRDGRRIRSHRRVKR